MLYYNYKKKGTKNSMLEDFILLQTKYFIIYGLYSKNADKKWKKILHYLPALIKLNKNSLDK